MKHKYLILLSFLLSLSCHAADGLGRLFLTPEQRAQLDAARVKRDQRAPTTTEATPEPVPAAPHYPGVVTYSGAVRRTDGKSTVWLNGKPVTERNRMRNDSEVSVLGMRRDGALSVAIPQAQRTASLKVGQSLDVMSGRIEESYARPVVTPKSQDSIPPTGTAAPLPSSSVITPAHTANPSTTTQSMVDTSRPRRPPRPSDFKDADPASGAAPPERYPPR